MQTGQTYPSSSTTFQVNRSLMITGAALIGTGALIALAGLIVGGTAMAAASREWLRQLDVPPGEALKHTWGQTKAAAAAGSAAWQQHNGIQRSHA
jgi:hypothetical protein